MLRSHSRALRPVLAMFVMLTSLGGASPAMAVGNSDTVDPGAPRPRPGSGSLPKWIAPPAAGFRWAVESRAHLWAQAWRPIKTLRGDAMDCTGVGAARKCTNSEQIYDPEYVHPSSFGISVAGCVSEKDWEESRKGRPTAHKYGWAINGQVVADATKCETTLRVPAQGGYKLTLTVDGKPMTQDARIKDILIVALGDSMSSGEGSPDVPRMDKTPARWVDRQCHRSMNGPAARAAQLIEDGDSSTSVTFISFACSGATIDTDTPLESFTFNAYEPAIGNNGLKSGTGLLGPYKGIEAPEGFDKEDMPSYVKRGGVGVRDSQVVALRRALDGRRKADFVIMSAGLNDARFSSMLATCILYSDCANEPVAAPGGGKTPLKHRFDLDTAKIPAMLQRLGKEISPMTNRTLLLEYPAAAFTNDNKKYCDSVLADVKLNFIPTDKLKPIGITAAESQWMTTYAGKMFSERLQAGAASATFDWVGGISNAFSGHGYCAVNHYVETAIESAEHQGPTPSTTTGTIHPNASGYAEMSRSIVAALTGAGSNARPRAVSDEYTATSRSILRVDSLKGVLANDSDPDLLTHLRVTRFEQPTSKVGKVSVDADGSFVYNPGEFTGEDTFLYTVTDGKLEAFGRVKIKVAPNATPAGPPVVRANTVAVRP